EHCLTKRARTDTDTTHLRPKLTPMLNLYPFAYRLRARVTLEVFGAHPEALFPALTGWNAVQLFVKAFLAEIHRVGDAGHRLDADEIAIRHGGGRVRRVADHSFVTRPEHDFQLLLLALDRHHRPAFVVANEVAKDVIEVDVLQRDRRRIGQQRFDRLGLAGRH